MTSDDEAAFHWELMKLLLQVAWADEVIDSSERESVMAMAQQLSLTPSQLEELTRCLDGHVALPAPNMQLLRARKQEVEETAQQLVLADDDIDDDENRVLVELHQLLAD